MMYQNSRQRDVLNELLKNKINYRDIPGSGVNLNSFLLMLTIQMKRYRLYLIMSVDLFVLRELTSFLTCAEVIKAKICKYSFCYLWRI